MDNRQKQYKYAREFKKGGTILELGSGAGDFLYICAEIGLKAAGVDRSSEKREGVKVIKKDIPAYLRTVKKRQYDGVYARHILEHFGEKDLNGLVKDIAGTLKEEGKLIAILPNIKNIGVATTEFWKDRTHVKPHTSAELKVIFEAHDLQVIRSGVDNDSWDNSAIKRGLRIIRTLISGVKNEPPDYYIIAVKK
jgi:SAM-dependent methyltransferase